MKAEELRIGNLIQANGPTMEVKSINEYSVELYLHGSEADNWEEDLENCEGIPLSPELLVKCGFEIANDGWGGYLSKKFNGGSIRISHNKWHNGCWDTEVNYVHQLQNLWYALTNTELEVNL